MFLVLEMPERVLLGDKDTDMAAVFALSDIAAKMTVETKRAATKTTAALAPGTASVSSADNAMRSRTSAAGSWQTSHCIWATAKHSIPSLARE